MPILIATRQLFGDWGNTPPNGIFETDEETAVSLESRGLAARYKLPQAPQKQQPKALSYDNKMILPENKTA